MDDHHGGSEIDTVEVNGGAGIGTGALGVRANPADGQKWGSYGVCETVTVGTRPARPSTVCTPISSRAVAGNTVMATGVDWTSAAPVFVAVTVILSATEDTASTRLSGLPVAPYFDLARPRLEPADRRCHEIAAGGKRIDDVFAVPVRDDGSRSD